MRQRLTTVARGWFVLALLGPVAGCGSDPPTPQETETETALEAVLLVSPETVLADGQATALLEVLVTQVADGAPAAGVALEAHSARNEQAEGIDTIDPASGVTDDQGRWNARISSATPGEAVLTVSSEGGLLCSVGASASCKLVEARVTFSEKEEPPPPACALTQQGEILRLTTTAGHTSYPVVAASPGGLLVAYDEDDEASGGMPFYGERAVYLARLDAQGAPSGEPWVISAAGVDASRPSLVATNTGYGLAYLVQQEGDTAVVLQRLDADGEPLGAPLQPPATASSPPSLAWGAEVFALAYSGGAAPEAPSSTWLALYDAQGAAVAAPVEVSADSSGDSPTYPRVATGEGSFAVVWQDRRDGAWDLYFRLMGPDGTPISDELAIRQDARSVAVAPQVVWTGSEFGVVYADTRHEYGHYQIYLARVAADGSAVLSEQQLSSAEGNADTPGLTFLDGRYFVSWVEKPWGGDAIPFALDAASGAIDTGTDLGLPYNGAAPDIGAVEFGCPWPASESWPTSLAAAMVEPISAQVSALPLLAQNEGFTAFPALLPVGQAVTVLWFDTLAAGGRDLFRAALTCASPPES